MHAIAEIEADVKAALRPRLLYAVIKLANDVGRWQVKPPCVPRIENTYYILTSIDSSSLVLPELRPSEFYWAWQRVFFFFRVPCLGSIRVGVSGVTSWEIVYRGGSTACIV
jgi:hypothetical protein